MDHYKGNYCWQKKELGRIRVTVPRAQIGLEIVPKSTRRLDNLKIHKVLGRVLRMEKAIAAHSSTLAWKIPWTEEPGELQSMRLWRVRQDWAASLSLFTFMHWRRKWQPLQCSCRENPRDGVGGGAWWAAIYGVAQSRTRLKRLSSISVLRKVLPLASRVRNY